jgi:DNA phosphorothioation-dependent restriction protein DptH
VAQRVADTFVRVYPQLGVQQHSALRHVVLEVLEEEGILSEFPETWNRTLPAFTTVHTRLMEYADRTGHPLRRIAATVASHVSTLFVFNTFRPSGFRLDWARRLADRHSATVLQLHGLTHSVQTAATEFLLWDLIGYLEASGPSPLRCFVVLDEAHRLSFERDTPVERLLREGRKFGVGLILASQQPEDFSPTAFANTATKLIFQLTDERNAVTKYLTRKLRNARSAKDLAAKIGHLPRAHALSVVDNIGQVVRVASFGDREKDLPANAR